MQAAREAFESLGEWSRDALHARVASVVKQLDIGFGKVAMPLRVAVTGGMPSPDLDLTLFLVGRDATLRRIDQAIAWIENANPRVE